MFDIGNDTVWSPALHVGDIYIRFVHQVGSALDVPTGLRAMASDFFEIDIDLYEAFVRRIFGLYFSTSHSVLRVLLEGVLAPSVVILERGGRPISPSSAEEQALIDRARELSMAR